MPAQFLKEIFAQASAQLVADLVSEEPLAEVSVVEMAETSGGNLDNQQHHNSSNNHSNSSHNHNSNLNNFSNSYSNHHNYCHNNRHNRNLYHNSSSSKNKCNRNNYNKSEHSNKVSVVQASHQDIAKVL